MKDSKTFVELYPKFGNDSRLTKDELGAIALVYDLTDGLKDFDANLFAEPELKFEYELALKAMFRLSGIEEKPKEEKVKPKAKKAKAEKKEKAAKPEAKAKASKEKPKEEFKGRFVRKESDEHKFVRRFLGIRKHPEMNLVINAYKELNKSVIDGTLKKEGARHPELIYAMQEAYYNVIMRKANSLELSDNLLQEAENLFNGERRYETVKYLSEYTGWTGKEKTEKQVELFLKKVENALKEAKKSDPYFDELSQVKNTLSKASAGQVIMPKSVGLAGIPKGFKIVK